MSGSKREKMSVGDLWTSTRTVFSAASFEAMPGGSVALITGIDELAGNVFYTMCNEHHRMDFLSFDIIFKRIDDGRTS